MLSVLGVDGGGLTLECLFAGVNYGLRETGNVALEVKYYKGEITKEEYLGCTWLGDRLAPRGGQRVRPLVDELEI